MMDEKVFFQSCSGCFNRRGKTTKKTCRDSGHLGEEWPRVRWPIGTCVSYSVLGMKKSCTVTQHVEGNILVTESVAEHSSSVTFTVTPTLFRNLKISAVSQPTAEADLQLVPTYNVSNSTTAVGSSTPTTVPGKVVSGEMTANAMRALLFECTSDAEVVLVTVSGFKPQPLPDLMKRIEPMQLAAEYQALQTIGFNQERVNFSREELLSTLGSPEALKHLELVTQMVNTFSAADVLAWATIQHDLTSNIFLEDIDWAENENGEAVTPSFASGCLSRFHVDAEGNNLLVKAPVESGQLLPTGSALSWVEVCTSPFGSCTLPSEMPGNTYPIALVTSTGGLVAQHREDASLPSLVFLQFGFKLHLHGHGLRTWADERMGEYSMALHKNKAPILSAFFPVF